MKRRSLGRPRQGEDGTRVADYPRQGVRLSPEQKERLAATAKVLGRSASSILVDAFESFYRVGLTTDQKNEIEDRMRKGRKP